MRAVGAQRAVAVVEHMRGGGDDVVGERQLARTMRVAAMYDAGSGVAAAQGGGVEATRPREFLDRGAPVGAEDDDRREERRQSETRRLQRGAL